MKELRQKKWKEKKKEGAEVQEGRNWLLYSVHGLEHTHVCSSDKGAPSVWEKRVRVDWIQPLRQQKQLVGRANR